jgi:voltage-dependent anion channel protein 2
LLTRSPRLARAQDLISGSFNYDNKFSLDAKDALPVDGLKVTASATQKNGASEPVGSVKSTLDVAKGLSVETEAALPAGTVTASASHSGLVDGLKLTVSGDPKNLPGAKVALQMLRDAVGVKCDLTNISSGAPKADVNACFVSGDLALGASAHVDCVTGAVSKYALAAQIVADDTTLAVVALNALDTVKGSVAVKLDGATSAAAEVTYGVKAKSASAALAVSKKFSDACSGKIAVSSALPITEGAVLDPVLSLYTTGDVAAKTTGSVSFQTDKSLAAKWGVQFATKI